MHVVTFYSYKGGVGRTMALVNTAILLAKRGRRVLIVDFDLEAPGLPTYDIFSCARDHIGIVDYIHEYLSTNSSPDVSSYISECDLDGRQFWIMPAGSNVDQGYSRRLNQIDWQALYDYRDGYLMFEDLRRQWAAFGDNGFDYVLIDSRTGYTDVGGICTRQLPDAVVAMYLPNSQNIQGLSNVISDIRSGDKSSRQIKLHFCPANVPDLDDERDILKDNLAAAQTALDYVENAAVIHYYASLDILKQAPFVIARPKSQLSREYGDLERAIISGNLEDRDGAVISLQSILSKYASERSGVRPEMAADALVSALTISEHHHNDPEIAYYLGRVFGLLNMIEYEVDALSVAIEGRHLETQARLRRARAYQSLGQQSDAIRDLTTVIASRGTEPFSLVPALTNLRIIDPGNWFKAAANMPALEYADASTINRVVSVLRVDRPGLDIGRNILQEALNKDSFDEDDRTDIHQNLILNLIGLKEFAEASALLNATPTELLSDTDVWRVFNGGVIYWGMEGTPRVDIFKHALAVGEFSEIREDPNFHQCMALSAYVNRDLELAEKTLTKAFEVLNGPARVFSCWTFTDVLRSEMMSHLRAMQAQGEIGIPMPPAVMSSNSVPDSRPV